MTTIDVKTRLLLTLPSPRAIPVVRSDGGSFALTIPDATGLRTSLLVDEKPVETLEYVGAVFYLPDGRLGYSEREGKKWRVNVGGMPGRFYQGMNRAQLSGDGLHLAYAGKLKKGVMVLVVDGEERYPEFNARGIALSHTGNHVAFGAVEAEDTDDEMFRVVVDGEAGRPFQHIRELQFSRDDVVAYVGDEKNGDRRVVEGTRESEPFSSVLGLGFTPKGQLWHTFSRMPRTAPTTYGYVIGGREFSSERSVSHVFFQDDDTVAGLLVQTEQGQGLARPDQSLLSFLETFPYAFAPPDKFAFVVNTLPGDDPKRFTAPKRVQTLAGITEPYTKIFQVGFPKGPSILSFAALQGADLLWCEVAL